MGQEIPFDVSKTDLKPVARKGPERAFANEIEIPNQIGVPSLDLTLFAPMDPTDLARAQRSIFEIPDDEQDSFRFDAQDPV